MGAVTRILVTGSRNWADRDVVFETLMDVLAERGHPADMVLVHGACPTGADKMADEIWCGFLGYRVERHPAEWSQFGRAAGPRRNQEMVDAGADLCVAFLMPGSRGTADCVKRAEAAGIPVRKVTA